MKKILIFAWFVIVSVTVLGQQVADDIMRARAEMESGNVTEALNTLNRSVAAANDFRLFIERAEANILGGDYSAAISDFNEANKTAAGSGEYGLARIYAIKGDAATSLYHLALSMNSAYKKTEKAIMLDPAFSSLENKPEWRQFWKKNWYNMLERDISEIEYYSSAGKAEEAKSLLGEIVSGYPGTDEVVYAKALVAVSSGRYAEAVNAISPLTVRYPENEKYLLVLAEAQSLAANPSGASGIYTRLIDSGVADADLFLKRADCYIKTGETGKALSDITRYLGYYPENKKALRMAGKTEARSGDNLKALDFFSRNLKLHPNDPECYIDRADAYFISRSWKWAIDDYSMSLDLDPGNSEAWLDKGISLINMGKTDDACHDFRISFRLGNKRATEYLSRYCIK